MTTHHRVFAPLLFALAASGCTVYDSDDDTVPPPPPPPPVPNYAPFIGDAEAGCYWDSYYRDDVWYFDAAVDDPNSVYEVTEVWADVYDEYYGPEYIESFELFPTNDPHVWFSDWMGSSTWLDCRYDGYTVDFVVYDQMGEVGYSTVWAYTY